MAFAILDGELQSVRRIDSPNADERPDPQDISLLVIHNISLPPGEFGSDAVVHLFTNRLDSAAHPYFAEIAHLRVSAHLFVARDGQVTQFVNLRRRAWHAGQSNWCGRASCNDFSIGIELEGTDYLGFSDAQYATLIDLTRTICASYPAIRADRIVGHEDIAPGRKTDPGLCFDWNRYLSALAACER